MARSSPEQRELLDPDVAQEFRPNKKTGTVPTAVAHTFCAVVGAGVLALPNSVAWLGWVAGPLCIIVFYLVSLMSSKMLALCYEVDGVEHARYHHAVRHLLGHRSAIWVSIFQLLNIFLTTIAYTITGVSGLQGIARSICQIQGVSDDSCFTSVWQWTLIFGAVELGLSQVKTLEEAWWMSAIGTIGSLIYAGIAFVLSAVHAGNGAGTIGGRNNVSTSSKVFGVFNALGSIGFAYNFSLILLEIQDTLRQPPSAASQMKRTVNVAITGSFFFYIGVAVLGYAANGNNVTGQVLESYSGPSWALIIANVALVAHMLTAFQVFGQAMFNSIESHVKWYILRREAHKAKGTEAIVSQASADAGAAAATAAATAAAEAGIKASPFDAKADSPAEVKPLAHQAVHGSRLGLDHIHLAPIAERASSHFSGDIGGGASRRLSQLIELDDARRNELARESMAKTSISRISMDTVRSAMHINVDTGFANEEVPLNEEHFYAPLYARLIIRSAYVLLITLLACIMPFFSAFAGLVGAVTFFPLAIYFPFACYRRVYRVSDFWNVALWIIWAVLLVVALLATVGSVQSIIVSWSTFTFFGN